MTSKNTTRNWNPYQTAIHDWFENGEDSLNIVARAGTGKTTTITHGTKYAPGRVLLAAFNKSAAEELRTKVPSSVDAKTGHSLGFGMLISAYGKPTVDEAKAKKVAAATLMDAGRWALGEGNRQEARTVEVNALSRVVSWAKNGLLAMDEQIERAAHYLDVVVEEKGFTAPVIANLTKKVMEACAADRKTIDFDDMVWLPVVTGLNSRRYDLVCVDEAQDTNAVMRSLYGSVLKKNGRFCAVGDDRQAIYAFRGADKDALDLIQRDYHSSILKLPVTYRCGKNIVQHVKYIVPDYEAAGAHDGIVRQGSANEARPGDFVICRTNAPLVRRCIELIKARVPAMVLGRDLAATAESLVKRSRATTVDGLIAWVEKWTEAEVAAMTKKGYEDLANVAADKGAMMLALAEGAESIAEVYNRINTLFGSGDAMTRVVLGTAHRMKGLERDRVFVLEKSFSPHAEPGSQESNLYYVACTRAAHELVLDQSEVR